jgi:small subunit ribosomal protein S17
MSEVLKKEKKEIVGTVVSDKMNKTRVVDVVYKVKHSIGKYVKRRSRLYVHDENNQSKIGDSVNVVSCRPMSKKKAWMMVGIKSKQRGSE